MKEIIHQILLLIWKRYKETIKSRWDIPKILFPVILFFSLLLLAYKQFNAGGGFLELFIVPLAFITFVQRIVTQITYEKSNRLQESMKMMGMSDLAYWLSYFITEGIITAFIISMICSIMSTGGGILFFELICLYI
jgi:glucose uptake protein GlcU